MQHQFKTFCVLLITLLMILVLAACGREPAPTTESTAEPTAAPVLSVTFTPGMSLESLEEYPALESADLRGCEDYEGILSYMAAHPEVEVTYEVSIGGQAWGNDTQNLTLTAAEAVREDLMANLKYLPQITLLSLVDTDWTMEELNALAEAYPNLELDYTVSIHDTLIGINATEINCSWLTPEEIPQLLAKLSLLPELQTVELMDESGNSALSLTDVKTLQDALPQVFFRYSFEFFGQTLSTSDQRVEYDRVWIGDENEALVRQALDILTCCTYFKLDDCGISYPLMASIRDDYPDVKVVWRVHVDHFNMLTDETVLRLTHRLTDDNVHDLKYLTDAVYLDMGHNEELTDISFVQYMPNLECVIISGAPVVDLSYFENCKKLVWMELCFCGWIRDISVFADHPTLKYLNISYTRVADITPLENVKLERFNAMHIPADQAQKDAFIEKNPDCYTVFTGSQPYGYGWRYDEPNFTMFEYYANMRIIFRYDDEKYWGNHREN